MGRRQEFFAVLEGHPPERMPFFPDITDWYVANRTPPGEPRRFEPGALIPDGDPIHERPGSIPAAYRGLTFLDFYRRFDWGIHVHIYDWFDIEYGEGVERAIEVEGRERRVRYRTPRGELVRRYRAAGDGSWAPRQLLVETPGDLDILRLVVEATRYVPRFDRVETVRAAIGDRGQGDLVIPRSPFGKLVHEYLGFERVIYALADDPGRIAEFLALQEEKDLELIRLAARAPERLVILSDHTDENLISPREYERFCVPYYRKIAGILHAAGKRVSTHLDGNFKGYFPLLGATGFDLLDGCTPAPMFNYEVEELAAALPPGMCAFCGVPAILFCRRRPAAEILGFGGRILRALRGRGILNVGDILPPDGDIEQVIALGRFANTREWDRRDG
ncbi:MAG: hypothetical protein JXP34_11630 [Planctomycetes bacterium]|nr:hypothetical protein [Planctomycetota bacterium]